MVLNIFALLFFLAIIFMNSLFGLYSGLINVVCCIASAAVAFGFFEPLNQLMTGSLHLHPSYTEPFALLLPFLVTLLVLRVLADNLIRGNVRVHRYLDWGGGAVCGFFVAQICVGIMLLSFLMLPWGGRVAMYQPIERDSDSAIDSETGRVHYAPRKIWVGSDRFTVALMDLLSNGSLSHSVDGKPNALASVYPDFANWVRWTGNAVQLTSLTAPIVDDKSDGFKNGLKVESCWEQNTPPPSDLLRYRKDNPTKGNDRPDQVRALYSGPFQYKMEPGHKFMGARLTLTRDSADREGGSAVHRFRPTQIRIVGDVGGEPRDYYPVIIGGADSFLGDRLRVADPDSNFTIPAPENVRIDVHFEVESGFQPHFIEYKRHARASLTKAALAASPPGDLIAAPVRDEQGNIRAQGAFRFVDIVDEGRRRGNNADLPFPISQTDVGAHSENAEFEGALFAGGRVMGDRAAVSGEKPDVQKFKVPEDAWICQIPVQARKARSMAGRAFNFVGGVTNQYQALDREGEPYWLAGYYAIVQRGDQQAVELFYTPDPTGSGSRAMLDWKYIQRNELEKDDTVIGLIFVVKKGRCIVKIKTSANQGEIEFGEDLCE